MGTDCRGAISEPSFSTEIEEHGQGDGQHQPQGGRVAPGPFQLRHVFEIHAVNPGQEGEGHKDGGNDGEDFHDFVQAVVDAGKINIQQPGGEVPVGVVIVNGHDGVVVD